MARSFNGTSDQINCGTGTSLNIASATSGASVCAWINSSSYANAFNQVFMRNASNSNLYGLYISTSPTANIACQTSGGTLGGNIALATNKWNHVAWTITSSSSGTTYVNGGVDTTGSVSFAAQGSATAGIGYDPVNSRFFPGNIADLAIWNVNLTAGEIAALAHGVRPYVIRPGSLRGYWPLDGYGHPALDRTIYNNNGVLTGTSLVVGPALINAAPIMLTTVNSGEAFLKRSPLMVAATLPKSKVAATSPIVFRKTLSQIGGRVGSRQIQGWAN